MNRHNLRNLGMNMNHAGVYIHIPFGRSHCSYCDFATGMYESGLAERYVNSLIEEIKDWGEVDNPAVVNTIYFGGGTPSLLTPAQIERILNAVRNRFQVLAGAEVTIELNPSDGGTSAVAKLETIRDFQQLGINRASFGAQTFDDRELKQLGRTHSSDDITSTFYQLREAGFENINFDLIAGLPGQTLQGWQRNLTAAWSCDLNICRFTCWMYTKGRRWRIKSNGASGQSLTTIS